MIKLKEALDSIYDKYRKYGVKNYYEQFGDEYQNPHKKNLYDAFQYVIDNWNVPYNSVLDMSAGSGEVTTVLMKNGFNNIEGSDPHTCSLYQKNTNKKCSNLSFNDIINGKLQKKYNTIICSYALHLCERSKLPNLIWQLSLSCNNLLIFEPTKYPEIKQDWGFTLKKFDKFKNIKIYWYTKND